MWNSQVHRSAAGPTWGGVLATETALCRRHLVSARRSRGIELLLAGGAGPLRGERGAQAPLAMRSRHSIADIPAARAFARLRPKSGPHHKKAPGLYRGHAVGLTVGLLEWPRNGGHRPRETPK